VKTRFAYYFLIILSTFNILRAQELRLDSTVYKIDFGSIQVNLVNFESPIHAAAARIVFRQKICHLVCRVVHFNQFVSEKVTDVDIIYNSLACDNNEAKPHRLAIGLSWFEEKKPLFCDFLVQHEMAHLIYSDLSQEQKQSLTKLYEQLPPEQWSVFKEGQYLYGEGEEKSIGYLFGHPDDGPEEMFASAFTLIMNSLNEKVFEALISNLKRAHPVAQIAYVAALEEIFTLTKHIAEEPMYVCNMWQ
jgi:hypothetical protein